MNRRKKPPKINAIKLSLLPSLSALGAIGCQDNAKMRLFQRTSVTVRQEHSHWVWEEGREKWNLMSFPGRFRLKSQFSTSGPPNNYALPKVKPTQESQFSGKLATICRREEPGLPNSKSNIILFAVSHLLFVGEIKIYITLLLLSHCM